MFPALLRYEVDRYSDKFSNSSFWTKVKQTFKSAGLNVIYKALQLFYVPQNPNVPMHIRAAVIAPLAYFISPIDSITDITPIVGYTDDASVIATAMVMAHVYIDENVKRQAKEAVGRLFGNGVIAELD